MTKGQDKGHKGHKGQMSDRDVMKLALDALLTWEEMHPKTTASAIRSPAIQALQKALEQEPWDTTDMAHRAGGLSMEQDEIVPSDYSGVTGDYSGVTGDYMEQEPVAWRQSNGIIEPVYGVTIPIGSPLYTTPPKREWVGLTDDEALALVDCLDPLLNKLFIIRAIKAKLKEKNTCSQ